MSTDVLLKTEDREKLPNTIKTERYWLCDKIKVLEKMISSKTSDATFT